MGKVKWKSAFQYAQSVHPTHAQSIIRASAVYSYNLILLVEKEGPDQIAWMRRLIWALAVRKYPDTFSHGAAHIASLGQRHQGNEKILISHTAIYGADHFCFMKI